MTLQKLILVTITSDLGIYPQIDLILEISFISTQSTETKRKCKMTVIPYASF